MKSAGRNALMASAILSSVFCLTTPVPAQKDDRAAKVAQEDKAAALAARAAARHSPRWMVSSPVKTDLGPASPGTR